jgi:hypothetical protein
MTMNRKARITMVALLSVGMMTMVPRGGLAAHSSGVTFALKQNSAVVYSGPLVITKGGTYSGNWQSLDPNTPAVLIQTREPVIIENSNIRSKGHLISGFYVNLTVRNTSGYGLNPNVNGAKAGRFVSAEDILSLTVVNNYMEGTSGIYTNGFKGTAPGQTIKVLRNRALNIDGRMSDGKGGYQNARSLVHFVQLGKMKNVPGIEVAWNEVVNKPGASAVEENINVYESSGTAQSPISIHDNYIQGAFAISPAVETEYSGGGIVVGDGDGTDLEVVGGFVNVFRNQVVATSNQGISIAGGHDQHVYDNRVVSSGLLPDGQKIAAQNVGLAMWDIVKGARNKVFFNNSVKDNVVGWTRFAKDGSRFTNNLWFPSCNADVKSVCTNNNSWPTLVTLATERQEFEFWKKKLQDARISVGPGASNTGARVAPARS